MKNLYRSVSIAGRIFIILTVLSLCNPRRLYAQDNMKIYHPLSGSLLLSLEYTETISQTDYANSIFSFGWRGYGEYFLPIYKDIFAGIRAYGGSAYLTGKSQNFAQLGIPTAFRTTIIYEGGGVEFGYRITDKMYPYVFGGATFLYFNPKDLNGHRLPNNAKGDVYSQNSFNGNLEIGLRYFLTDQVAVDASFTQNFNTNDYLDDIKIGKSGVTSAQFNVGVSIALFAKKDSDHDGVPDYLDKCPDTPAGVKVDATGCPLDSDGDGVPDYKDKCPNTPPGVKVDSAGCPLDSDGDGVPDYLDKCPNTPHGVKVDAEGCPLDSDGDGVPDYKDKCPNTPPGVKVDSVGCPLDSDLDGVPDYKDKCPNTPPGVIVDSVGCPLDSDGDGVPDYKDRCPNTPHGVKVDSTGCPIQETAEKIKTGKEELVKRKEVKPKEVKPKVVKPKEVKPKEVKPKEVKPKEINSQETKTNAENQEQKNKFVFSSSSIFESRSAFITSSAYPELNTIAAIIKADTSTRWRIEGFTDFNNAASFNQTLSFNRANAVYIYFIEKGINRNRFDVIGEGKYLPYNGGSGKGNVGVIISKLP